MTDDEIWSIYDAALGLMCPRCEARPGEPCRTVSGKPAQMHVPRWEPLSIAFGNPLAKALAAQLRVALDGGEQP